MSQRLFPFWQYLAPQYWPTWLGLGLLRLLVLLPYPLLLWLGAGIGRLSYLSLPRRRRIVRINIALAFPQLSPQEQQRLVRANFRSTGIAVLEAPLSWWGSDRRLRHLYQVEGIEHLQAAQAQGKGKGVILLGGHYTTLELSGRFLAFHLPHLQPIYKPAHNALFDALMVRRRKRLFDDLLLNSDMRTIIRNVKAGKVVWYAPDQDFGRESAVFAPFMGIPTASLTTTARLARLTGAPVMPYYSQRLPGRQGYRITVLPPLQDFPSGDDVADATRINQVLEQHVRAVPEQYLWSHRRFKTRPPGETSPYRRRKS